MKRSHLTRALYHGCEGAANGAFCETFIPEYHLKIVIHR
jgi:hypothetical protein